MAELGVASALLLACNSVHVVQMTTQQGQKEIPSTRTRIVTLLTGVVFQTAERMMNSLRNFLQYNKPALLQLLPDTAKNTMIFSFDNFRNSMPCAVLQLFVIPAVSPLEEMGIATG